MSTTKCPVLAVALAVAMSRLLRARLKCALSHARSKWLCVIHTVVLRNLGGAEAPRGLKPVLPAERVDADRLG